MNADERGLEMHGRAAHATVGRREFLRGLARQAAAGGLLVGSGLLVLRGGSDAGADCVKAIRCGGCEVFGECGLPRALAVREMNSANPVSKG